jgi:hypothetical protein
VAVDAAAEQDEVLGDLIPAAAAEGVTDLDACTARLMHLAMLSLSISQ